MMNILPYRRFVLESRMAPSRVVERLSENVGRRRLIRFGAERAAFEGEVRDMSFQISRIVWYSNSFLPKIVGRIEPGVDGGSKITVVMRLSRPTAIFMSIWFAGVILIGLPVMVASLRSPPFTWMDLIPVGMLAAGGALTLGGFLPEARIALRKLMEITESARDGVDARHPA